MDISLPSIMMGGFLWFAQIVNIGIRVVIAILSIYGLVLFIKLAKRGIKVLDIHIEKNKEEK